ncbi:MAG: glycosyltransferase family 39 protein [Candidatus Omnitrophota bacterium]
MKKARIKFLLFLIFVCGFALRIYKLGQHNLWYDEFFTLVTSNNLSLERLCHQIQSPLYFVFLRQWMNWFGSSELALRLPSTLFNLLCIPIIYRIGKLLFDRKAGLVSAFMLAVSPFHIWYSQEARGYTLATPLALATVYLFTLALKKNRMYLWIGFAVFSILAVYASYFSFFIIFFTGLFVLLKNRRQLLKRWIVSLCFILLAFSPWLPVLFRQAAQIKDGFWTPKPSLGSLLFTFENFNVGYSATPSIYLLSTIIFSALFILGISRWKREKDSLILLMMAFFIPVISVFFISQWMPVYLDRQLMMFSPFYYIIIAAGLGKIKSRPVNLIIYGLISVSIFSCLYNYHSYRMPVGLFHHIGVHPKRPVKPAADYISIGFRRGDIIAFSEESSISLLYYLPKKQRNYFYFIIESKLEHYWYSVKWRYGTGMLQSGLRPRVVVLDKEESSIPGARNIGQYNFKRIWLISSSWPKDGELEAHAAAVREWMKANYELIEGIEFEGIFIDLYKRKF